MFPEDPAHSWISYPFLKLFLTMYFAFNQWNFKEIMCTASLLPMEKELFIHHYFFSFFYKNWNMDLAWSSFNQYLQRMVEWLMKENWVSKEPREAEILSSRWLTYVRKNKISLYIFISVLQQLKLHTKQ